MKGSRGRITVVTAVALGLALAACDAVDAPPGPDQPVPEPLTATTVPPSSTSTTARACRVEPPNAPISLEGSPVAQAVAVSRAVFECADRVALTRPSTYEQASAMAAREQIPLLIWDPSDPGATLDEIERLDPTTLVATSATITPPLDLAIEPISLDDREEDDPATVWVTSEEGTDGPAGSHAARLAGAAVLRPGPGGTLTDGQIMRLRSASEVVVYGDVDPTTAWRVETLRNEVVTVSGTPDLFEGTRFVAFYGNPTTPALGVLGEQGPDASIARLAPIVDEYAADGRTAIPTFEIIMTVADAVPGDDGNYSAEMDPVLARPWIEAATAAGGYVILDLQPGRTDFLTQAMRYEDLLRLPNVGLALDPEWRLEPDQFHLRQIGSVDAEEVNRVSEWLAGLVREHELPQKMLLLHQFRLDMLPDRSQIALRPELATVVQMDGQGPLGTKYDTYDALTSPADAVRFHWGWKNFYDEDSPTATASQVLVLEPLPVLVSFQ